MKDFRAGRALFVGDAAHQVSPFGARGANSGFQDTDELIWKLQLVMDGKAPEALLDTYSAERTFAADENLMNSTRSTDFITPKSRVSKVFRNAVLDLAQDHAFARRLVNSGRLSVPAFLTKSALNTPDSDSFAGDMVPGAPMDDAPIQRAGQDAWLLDQLGNRFQLLVFADRAGAVDAATLAQFKSLAGDAIAVEPVVVTPSGGQIDGVTVLADCPGPGGPPLRREARHRLPGPPGPACGRPLARLRPRPSARRRGPRNLQRLSPKEPPCPCNSSPTSRNPASAISANSRPGDDFYEALIETHRDLSDEQSEALNARLILLLANHIGDIAVLREALALARRNV